MARPRKAQNTKTATTGVTPDAFAAAISEAVAQALDPISQKLDEVINGNKSSEEMKVDDATLTLMGVDNAQALGDVMEAGAEMAADALEEGGSPIAAAVVDAGLDTAEVVKELVKGRKARKAAGETLEPVTAEEVADVIEAVAEEVAEDLSEEEIQQLADDGFVDEAATENKETDPDTGAKQRGKPKTRVKKSAYGASRQTKRATSPPIQRKYGQFFSQASKEGTMLREQKELPPIVRLARAVKCADYFARGGAGGGFADPERAAWAAQKFYKDANLARQFKSMSVTQPGSAGILVPQDYVSDIVEMLYNNTVLFELGARKIPMPHGNISVPRQTSGARAYFGGEQRPINPTNPQFNMLHMSAKRLQAMVIMTEELLRSTDISSDQIFGNDLITQMKLGIEWGGLLGRGVEFEPLGLMHNPAVEMINLLNINDRELADAQGRPTSDLPIFVKGQVLTKNVVGTSFGWVMNSEAEQYFKRMKSDDGKYIWKEEMDKGTFNGDPYRSTNMIPTDAINGTTSLIFGNWSDFLLGEQFGLETRTSYDATIQTEGGMVNTFQSVQTATRATTYVDMGNRHDESFIKVINVKVRG